MNVNCIFKKEEMRFLVQTREQSGHNVQDEENTLLTRKADFNQFGI